MCGKWVKSCIFFWHFSWKLQFSGNHFQNFLNLQSWSWKISIHWWLKTSLWLRLLRWPPKELPQCLILHQEHASFQLQRTAPVLKSSLSMILSEMLSENWELGLGTRNCKAVELPKHFLDKTAPWFLFHKVLCFLFHKVLCWKFLSPSIDFSVEHMLSLWQKLHQFCVNESCFVSFLRF